MGVTYKLKDEVVQYIIEQRQVDPYSSCRELAESASGKFGLRLSKSSVHDVLKESGIITPRGRKPKNKFEIPQEKKKQIQSSLSKIKINLVVMPDTHSSSSPPNVLIGGPENAQTLDSREQLRVSVNPTFRGNDKVNVIELPPPPKSMPPLEEKKTTTEYEGAGKIFAKAALWDLGLFTQEEIKELDWAYYLTYCKGVKLELENNQSVFIDLPLPIERCIRETADALVNNIKPMIIHHVSDKALFKACMDNLTGSKISNIIIMDQNNHNILEFSTIVECKRNFIEKNRLFVEYNYKSIHERARKMFFSHNVNPNIIDEVSNIMGFDSMNSSEIVVNLLIKDTYEWKADLEHAAELLNSMYIKDGQARNVMVKIQVSELKL